MAIDGVQDAVTPISYATGSQVPPMWQLVSGPQGSVVTVRTLATDINGLNVSTVYQDRSVASPAQCTGDGAAWGQNGVNLVSPVNNVPNTDPTLGANPNTLVTKRIRFFRGADLAPGDAATLDQQARTPVQISVG